MPHLQHAVVPGRLAIFLATSGHSGVDREPRNLIPELARRGFEVDVLQVRGHGPHLGVDAIPAGVRVFDLGHAHVYGCVLAVARYLRRRRPAVLLTDKDRVNRTGLVARWLAAASVTRLAFFIGTPPSAELAHRNVAKRWLRRRLTRWLYPVAERFLADSPGVAADFAAFAGIDSTRIHVVPRPVVPRRLLDAPPPPPDHPWFTRDAVPVILGVGELSPGKDFATLLRAFVRLRAERPCRLMLIGKGRLHDALLAQARDAGVGADVELAGFRDDVYGFIAHAAVLALASRREGLSFVLIEAMACGTPVVSTDCPHGPRAVLDDGRHGALVPVGDDAALAVALGDALDRPLPAAQLRQAAQRYAIPEASDALLDALKLPRVAGA
jgi:glycosyltransferase involved in cell wall biosynthesis